MPPFAINGPTPTYSVTKGMLVYSMVSDTTPDVVERPAICHPALILFLAFHALRSPVVLFI